MLKKTILSVALMGACTTVMANNYTYVAGGLQYGSISSNDRFDKQFDRSNYSHIGNRDMGEFTLTVAMVLIMIYLLMAA